MPYGLDPKPQDIAGFEIEDHATLGACSGVISSQRLLAALRKASLIARGYGSKRQGLGTVKSFASASENKSLLEFE